MEKFDLAPAEWNIMECLWERAPQTGRELTEHQRNEYLLAEDFCRLRSIYRNRTGSTGCFIACRRNTIKSRIHFCKKCAKMSLLGVFLSNKISNKASYTVILI